ncbi:MAG: suppressor of fused domain protein [Actinomycetota bacterium]|nr:suppressor of fused domain protein [Actinomycetota bacterium]
MTTAQSSAREVAHTAAAAFGGTPSIHRYHDEPETHAVDILSCGERPRHGYTCYSTVDLHRAPNALEEKDIRVELAGVAEAEVSRFPNVLATAAFCVMKDGWLCAPGVVFPSLLSEYELSDELEHVLWVPPFPWERLAEVSLSGGARIHWLLAVPISESERRFLEDAGYDHLEREFADREIDYFDLSRPAVV